MTQPEPFVRYAARAVLVDERQRTLLFRARVPGSSGRYIWITPGGGINDGEAEPDCVRREVFEETGLRDATIGPCVWRRDHTFRWGEGWLRQVETYYLVRTPAFEVTTEHHEELERSFLADHRWFSLEELVAHEETLVPGNFAALLGPLLRGDIPAEPIIVGI
ncbi:MAG: NUDIX hydrolase [Dehalococcoidia bacterium]